MSAMRVVVIGNGIAGFSAASTIRRLNEQCEITMIAREAIPLYSACVLPDYISGKISRDHAFVKTNKDYSRLHIHTYFGLEVKEIDPQRRTVTLDDRRRLPYDRLVLAIGSDAVVFGEHKKGIFKLKTLQDADEIIEHDGNKAVVIGAGAIGIEIAIALRSRGYKVTMVEMMDQILPLGLDQRGADKVRGMLEERGIAVLNGERAIKTLGGERVEGLATDKRELECDTVVWAVGMRPRVELARQAGIGIGERGGIRVDAHMETSTSGIYACGDCVESPDILTGESYLNLFWHNANRQGAVAAQNCIGQSADYPGSENIVNLDIFGNQVAGFGFTEEAAHRFQDIPALHGTLADLSIIEHEQDGSYYRLVILGDRCIGGQFINITRDIGMLWGIMVKRRSIAGLLEMFANEALMDRRPWLHRIRPFFRMK
ncbi:MAG: NAD(P)/FAD-dependent oxidoreductase [Deltaproteobacteria bacterium]|nr:MAG: NAD(P)/FAD-dependent oxidoreductase [Deltaproteobacteria bacterium]